MVGAKNYHYIKFKDNITKTNNEYYKNNKEKCKTDTRERYRKNKNIIYDILGRSCSCEEPNCWHDGKCNINDIRLLHLDHIDNDGGKQRKILKGSHGVICYYIKHLDLIKQDLRVMCPNCNWIKEVKNSLLYKH